MNHHHAAWLIVCSMQVAIADCFIPEMQYQSRIARGGVLAMAYDHFVSSSTSARVEGRVATTGMLEAYMQLPVEQYAIIPMPFGASLRRLSENSDCNEFLLTVSPVRFPGVLAVQPMVWCTATPQEDRVCITSEKCELSGSPIIAATRLNDRFRFFISTNITWSPFPPVISSRSRLEVWVDPPAVFRAIPKAILEASGNAAMNLAIRQIEGAFIRALMSDYERWATDDAYRDERARSC